jgi:phospholipid/cholesterol/gamma-HCH transport system ATP-binding protein
MSVYENLVFPLKRIYRNLSDTELLDRAKKVLKDVGLLNAIYKMPSELSGGMRKRIGLARTLIISPEIMLYDEPTTGLDPVTSREISLLINKAKEEYKTSSIIITHDIDCAELTGDRIVMIKDGEIFAEGSYDELNQSNDSFIKSFFISKNK